MLTAIGKTVFFGRLPHDYLHALDADTGLLYWKFDADESAIGTPTYANRILYFGDYEDTVYALLPTSEGTPSAGSQK